MFQLHDSQCLIYLSPFQILTHWGRVTLICISKLTIIDSDNGLSPGRHLAIIWTNAGILLIRTSGTNFSEIPSEIHTFSFKKMYLKMSSAKWRPFCVGVNEPKSKLLWHHSMEMLSNYCPLWVESTATNGFLSQRSSNGYDVFFVVGLSKLLNKQSSCCWFETPWCSCDVIIAYML